jgi:hypothetical protein
VWGDQLLLEPKGQRTNVLHGRARAWTRAGSRAFSQRRGFSYLGVKHDLRGPVPARGHILCQEASVVMLRVRDPGQAKVTDLESDPAPELGA